MFDEKHVFTNVTSKLTLKMTLHHQNNIRNVFSSQNANLNSIFRHFDPQIGLLTLKITLNHQNNIRIELSSQNYTETRYYIGITICLFVENHIFTHSTFKLTFDLENDLESS